MLYIECNFYEMINRVSYRELKMWCLLEMLRCSVQTRRLFWDGSTVPPDRHTDGPARSKPRPRRQDRASDLSILPHPAVLPVFTKSFATMARLLIPLPFAAASASSLHLAVSRLPLAAVSGTQRILTRALRLLSIDLAWGTPRVTYCGSCRFSRASRVSLWGKGGRRSGEGARETF